MIKIDLDKNKRYLLACSYGPDSMALFDLLQKNHINFEVAHVNYGLRAEADEETANLINYCEQAKVKLHFYRQNDPILTNIEEKCREIRYSFFKKTLEESGLDSLLVAHNEDDNIETYILQRYRKNIVEHFGLEKETIINGYLVIRPLLSISKSDILAYNEANKVPFAIDTSNLQDKFLRNRIRHHIVQKMSDDERKRVIFEIKELNLSLKENHKKIREDKNLNIDHLVSYSDQDLAYLFTVACRNVIPGYELSLKQVKEFRNIMLSPKPNVVIKLRGGLFFIKSYVKVEIKSLPKETNFSFTIDKPCKFDCDYFSLNFLIDSSNRNVTENDYPLVIRNAYKNDEVKVKDYYVKMRRQFINWKMPEELRKRWPIILDKNGNILYVPRYNSNFKPDENTNFYVKV